MDISSKSYDPMSCRYDRRKGHLKCDDAIGIIHLFWPSFKTPKWEEWQEHAYKVLSKIMSELRDKSYSRDEVRWFSGYTKLDPKTENFKEFNRTFIDALHDYWTDGFIQFCNELIEIESEKLSQLIERAGIKDWPLDKKIQEIKRLDIESIDEYRPVLDFLTIAEKIHTISSVKLYCWGYKEFIIEDKDIKQ